MRIEDLKIVNLTTQEQVDQVRRLLDGITGVEFSGADLEKHIIEFTIAEDLDDLTLTDIQCRLRDAGLEAGEVVEGETCTLRLRSR
jgi:hypothetical protein